MNKTTLLLFLLITSSLSFGQQYKTVTIIKERTYALNGGARSYIDGQSREIIKIDLPENAKGCYYSFTTTPGLVGPHY
ncbi:hypothetical protein [Flavobacterium phycosphaerae]|uniref:hypothetical protein n=1 Tax=Flavobacterium phycosphaerae TaxID=2697515 RepID=UPI00138A2D20|nr:hypothetical protein [Flavobacterium phycosphaerae]